jgi:hypothetical protein
MVQILMHSAFPTLSSGPDTENPDNITINDVLGDFSLTLIDSLDMLALMGNTSEFRRAVRLVVDTVHFDKSNTVQVARVMMGFVDRDNCIFPGV